MASYPVVCCLDCQIAWKGGGICTRCKKPSVYMGKRWRAPKSNNDRVWRAMRKGHAAEKPWREWALWDQPSNITPKVGFHLTPEDYRRMKENRRKAKENVEHHASAWLEEMRRLGAEAEQKRLAIKAKIKEHRKAKRLAERSQT